MLRRAARPQMKFSPVAAREKSVSAHVPYVRHADEQTLRTKEGFLVSCIKLDGFCFQTADQSEINLRLSARNTLVRALNDSRFALYSHIIRRDVPAAICGDFDNAFCAELDRRYMDSLRDKRMFTNDLYLTIIRRGFQGRVGKIDGVMRGLRTLAGQASEDLDKDARRELREAVANIVNTLEPYGARVLKLVSRKKSGDFSISQGEHDPAGPIFSEPCEFLAQLLNGGVELPMLLPRMGRSEEHTSELQSL